MLPTQLLTQTATLPTRGSEQSAGLDLYLDLTSQFDGAFPEGDEVEWDETTTLTLQATNRTVLKTGIAVAIPEGYYGQIAPRSGLAVKGGLEILAGVIDADYRGELMVAVLNSGQADVEFKHGDRVAQLLILPCSMATPVQYSTLPDTDRGEGGFGSTGD
jgi:dUTP pyrophosphatase